MVSVVAVQRKREGIGQVELEGVVMVNIRTLYDCQQAKYPSTGQYITCDKGHKLGGGYVSKRQADRGDILLFRICSLCPDFESMGEPFER